MKKTLANVYSKQKEREKMTNKMQIHNLIVLDESGSMEAIKESTLKGFQQLGRELKSNSLEYPNQEHYVTLVTFNGIGIKNRLTSQPVEELMDLNDRLFKPDSNTPLYDAICKSVLTLKHHIYGIENFRVLVTIITDGMENSSTEFSEKETKLLIQNMSNDKRWGFGLIGAEINVDELAEKLSIPLIRTIQFDHNSDGVETMFKRYGNAQRNMAASFAEYDDFDDDILF